MNTYCKTSIYSIKSSFSEFSLEGQDTHKNLYKKIIYPSLVNKHHQRKQIAILLRK